jgi:hypothetical protein
MRTAAVLCVAMLGTGCKNEPSCPAGSLPDFTSTEATSCAPGSRIRVSMPLDKDVLVECLESRGRRFVCRLAGAEWRRACEPWGVSSITSKGVECHHSPDGLTKAESAVTKFKGQIASLSAEDERLDRTMRLLDSASLNTRAQKLTEDAKRTANALRELDESDMNFGHIIAKWEYAAVGYTICAQWNTQDRGALASDAVRDARHATDLVAWIRRQAALGESYYISLAADLDDDDEPSRISYITAVGLSLQYSSTHDETLVSQIASELERFSARFRAANPPEVNSWLRPYAPKHP